MTTDALRRRLAEVEHHLAEAVPEPVPDPEAVPRPRQPPLPGVEAPRRSERSGVALADQRFLNREDLRAAIREANP